MSHFVVEQHHNGVWKTIARRPTNASAQRAVREIRRDVKKVRVRVRKVAG